MKKLAEKFLESTDIWEMSNLWPSTTNLPVIIFVSFKGKSKHDPRIKVMTHKGRMDLSSTVPVSISDNPEVLEGQLSTAIFKQVREWIIINKIILTLFWDGKIDTGELIGSLKKI
jgi:hypothetical protein